MAFGVEFDRKIDRLAILVGHAGKADVEAALLAGRQNPIEESVVGERLLRRQGGGWGEGGVAPVSGREIAPAGGVATNEPSLGVVLKDRVGEVLGVDAKTAAGRRRPRGAPRLGAESLCASAGSATRRVNSTFHRVSHGGDPVP